MVVDLELYKINKDFVQKWFLSQGKHDVSGSISIMAISTGCPCIVVAFWIGEIIGFSKEMIDHIEDLKKFYDYTDIKGVPDSYRPV